MKTLLNRSLILVSVLASLSLTQAADLPLGWRGQAGTTYQEWLFNSAANPSLPDVARAAVAAPAIVVPGDFSSGWVQQLSGSWDLGRNGTIALDVPSGCNYIAVQVEQMIDGAIYGTLASVTIPGATLVSSKAQELSGDSFSGWTASQTVWQVPAGTTASSAVITGAYDGTVVNSIVLETLTGEPTQPAGVQLSIRQVSGTQVEVSWPTVDGAALQWNSSVAGSWTPVGIAPQVNGDRSFVVLELTESMRFLRVQQP